MPTRLTRCTASCASCAAAGFARCFIALHGRHGEDGTVQGALELLGIPYTGPGVMASSIAMDKTMTKRIWRAEGLPTPDWRLVRQRRGNAQALGALGAPMIVKPAREGSTHRSHQGNGCRRMRTGLCARGPLRRRSAVRAVHRGRGNYLPRCWVPARRPMPCR